MSKKREKRHISSLMCFTSLASVDGSTFFLNVNVCLLRENIPEKTFFYIIFISSSFVNKPKVSFSNPFAFRHSTKIIFYQKNSLQTSYANTSYQIWKLLAVFSFKLFEKEKCNKTIQKSFQIKSTLKKNRWKKQWKCLSFSSFIPKWLISDRIDEYS